LGFQWPPEAMLGSCSRKDLSTSSRDTSLMFTSNLPSECGREGKWERGKNRWKE